MINDWPNDELQYNEWSGKKKSTIGIRDVNNKNKTKPNKKFYHPQCAECTLKNDQTILLQHIKCEFKINEIKITKSMQTSHHIGIIIEHNWWTNDKDFSAILWDI